MTFLTIAAIITSILVVVNTSTVFSVLWLVATFIITSGILSLLNLGFPALIYVIVYVGAIAILFLFVIQLLGTDRQYDYKSVTKTGPLAILFSVGIMSLLITFTASLTIYEDLHSLGILVRKLGYSTIYGELLSGEGAIDNIVGLSQLTQDNSLQVESLAE